MVHHPLGKRLHRSPTTQRIRAPGHSSSRTCRQGCMCAMPYGMAPSRPARRRNLQSSQRPPFKPTKRSVPRTTRNGSGTRSCKHDKLAPVTHATNVTAATTTATAIPNANASTSIERSLPNPSPSTSSARSLPNGSPSTNCARSFSNATRIKPTSTAHRDPTPRSTIRRREPTAHHHAIQPCQILTMLSRRNTVTSSQNLLPIRLPEKTESISRFGGFTAHHRRHQSPKQYKAFRAPNSGVLKSHVRKRNRSWHVGTFNKHTLRYRSRVTSLNRLSLRRHRRRHLLHSKQCLPHVRPRHR